MPIQFVAQATASSHAIGYEGFTLHLLALHRQMGGESCAYRGSQWPSCSCEKTVQWPPLQAGLAGLYAANQVGAVCFFLAAARAFELHVYGKVQ